MKYTNKLLALILIVFCQNVLADTNNAIAKNAFKPVEELFEAMSAIDHAGMKAAVTTDFILLEHGEVWNIDGLIDVVNPSEYKRTNYFSVVNTHHQNDVVWINYWNKANFSNGVNSNDVVWLESVVVVKQNGKWVLSQMHSTRLNREKFPKGIEYKRAKK